MRIVAIAIALVLVPLLGLGVARFTGVPDFPDRVRESIAVAKLQHHADKAAFERYLISSGADWHEGNVFQKGESFSSFEAASPPCVGGCRMVVQAEFTRTLWFCEIDGDVVSASFDDRQRLKTWRVIPAVDGC